MQNVSFEAENNALQAGAKSAVLEAGEDPVQSEEKPAAETEPVPAAAEQEAAPASDQKEPEETTEG